MCLALVGGSRVFDYVCNPNNQHVPHPPVRESSHSPYLFFDKVGTNSCKHLIDMQVSGNESVHNLVGRLMTTEAVQMPVLPLTYRQLPKFL